MKRTCLICHAAFESSDNDSVITQDICARCNDRLFSERPTLPLGEFLDRIEEPVLLMDDDVRVAGYNRAAHALLGGPRHDIEGRLAGEVIECEFAHLPGGCGHTKHCKGCTLRNAITTTHQTGKSQRNIGIGRRGLVISTEKTGRFVMLRIEKS